MKATRLLPSIFVFLLAATNWAYAQGVGASGYIKGTILDASGGVLPKVKVVVAETEKGLQRTTATDDKGEYRVSGLSPATYDVSVELAGFQGEIRKGVVVTVGQTVIADFQLKVSQVATAVEVTTEPPVVETERAHQAETWTEQYIRNLPINRRDYLTYTLLVPGVSDSTRLASDQDFRVKQTPQSGLSFYGSNLTTRIRTRSKPSLESNGRFPTVCPFPPATSTFIHSDFLLLLIRTCYRRRLCPPGPRTSRFGSGITIRRPARPRARGRLFSPAL